MGIGNQFVISDVGALATFRLVDKWLVRLLKKWEDWIQFLSQPTWVQALICQGGL